MKKLPIIFLFSVTFPSCNFSEWIEVASTESGYLTWYYGPTPVLKIKGFFNYLELTHYVSKEQ